MSGIRKKEQIQKMWKHHQIWKTEKISKGLNIRYLKRMNEVAIRYLSLINEGFIEPEILLLDLGGAGREIMYRVKCLHYLKTNLI